MPSPTLTFRLPADLMRRLWAAAERNGETRTAIAVRALTRELDAMERA